MLKLKDKFFGQLTYTALPRIWLCKKLKKLKLLFEIYSSKVPYKFKIELLRSRPKFCSNCFPIELYKTDRRLGNVLLLFTIYNLQFLNLCFILLVVECWMSQKGLKSVFYVDFFIFLRHFVIDCFFGWANCLKAQPNM